MAHNVSLIPHLEHVLSISGEKDKQRIQSILADITAAKEEGYDVAELIVSQTRYDAAFRFPEPNLVKVIYRLANDAYSTNNYGWVKHHHAYVLRRFIGDLKDVNNRRIYQDYYTRRYYVVGGSDGSPSHLGYCSFELPELSGEDEISTTKQTLIEMLRRDLARLEAE